MQDQAREQYKARRRAIQRERDQLDAERTVYASMPQVVRDVLAGKYRRANK